MHAESCFLDACHFVVSVLLMSSDKSDGIEHIQMQCNGLFAAMCRSS